MLPRKYAIKMYFIFPHHLTSASALPGETGNMEIASFHLNDACFTVFFTRNTRNALKYHLVAANHPSLSKRST